jgi:hypothetical protein
MSALEMPVFVVLGGENHGVFGEEEMWVTCLNLGPKTK